MPKRQKTHSLDLHHIKFQTMDIQFELEMVLDRFISPHLLNSKSKAKSKKLEIIVGKGLNSNRLIRGKSPLRYYTEIYLQKLNLEYKVGTDFFGEGGLILVWV